MVAAGLESDNWLAICCRPLPAFLPVVDPLVTRGVSVSHGLPVLDMQLCHSDGIPVVWVASPLSL